jgi:hypothetical protein
MAVMISLEALRVFKGCDGGETCKIEAWFFLIRNVGIQLQAYALPQPGRPNRESLRYVQGIQSEQVMSFRMSVRSAYCVAQTHLY